MTTHLCPHELETIKQFVLPGSVVFDIGANEGIWTTAVFNHCKDVTVHAFDPSPAFDTYLRHHSQRPNVRMNRVAVDDKTGTKTFFIAGQSNCEHSNFFGSGKPVGVKCVSLDDYCAEHGIEHINLLKIDTEGHEHCVFRGAQRLLSEDRVDVIQFEYNGLCKWSEVAAELTKHGWEFYHIYGQTLVPIEPMSDDMDMTASLRAHDKTRLRQANVVALKPNREGETR